MRAASLIFFEDEDADIWTYTAQECSKDCGRKVWKVRAKAKQDTLAEQLKKIGFIGTVLIVVNLYAAWYNFGT